MPDLIIVESPTKAKTISKFLGKKYTILSSFGHVRDLPKSKLGVDVENNFEPSYVIPTKSRKHVTALKKAAAKADTVYFATDEDREGEAISWHLSQILDVPADKTKRITFHEITKTAIQGALEEPRTINDKMVEAQQARRILDRLVGYKLSPLLWKKVQRGLSAGRVQSVAVRLIVDREAERDAFNKEEYWTIDAVFSKDGTEFEAKLVKQDGKTLEKLDIKTEKDAKALVDAVEKSAFSVAEVRKKTVKKKPPTPLTTSSLQQAANNKLGMSAKQTMRVAQQLYETGKITYMRTDSQNLADAFLNDAAGYLTNEFGEKYALEKPRKFKTKSKGAQEAHEAIRPTDVNATPDALASELDPAQKKLYDLIWRRTLATQMPEAELERTSIDIAPDGVDLLFRASGSVIVFDGFMKVYRAAKETILPHMEQGDSVEKVSITPTQHFTEPPARYSDATLVKALEEHGIGRPSTYAPTIHTVIDRGYVERDDNKKLFPTPIAKTVTELLVKHFPNIVDFEFTAVMEQSLDEIADGTVEWIPVLETFYGPFSKILEEKEDSIEKMKPEEIPTEEVCEKCGKPMVIKFGRYGKFLACTGFPDCKNTKPLKQDSNEVEIITTDEKCPKCDADMEVKQGRYGSFLSCSRYPDCKSIKSLAAGTGVKCPKCKKGEIGTKRSKRGRTFYGCDQYPDCDFALWKKPTGETCPDCKSLLTFGAKGKTVCSNKECGFSKETEQKDD